MKGASDAHTDTLVARCQAGDKAAFEQLYRAYAAPVFKHLRAILGPSEDAQDALQATFVEAFRNIGRFRGDSRVSSWLHGIAVRVALNQIRGKKRRSRAMSAFTEETLHRQRRDTGEPEAALDTQLQASQLYRHLQRVDDKKRAAFLLYFVEQLEISEVAERIGTTPAAAWARVKRAREQVVKAFERETLSASRRQEQGER